MAAAQQGCQGLDRRYPLCMALQEADGVGAYGMDVGDRPTPKGDPEADPPVPAIAHVPDCEADQSSAARLQPALQESRSFRPGVLLSAGSRPDAQVQLDEQAAVTHEGEADGLL